MTSTIRNTITNAIGRVPSGYEQYLDRAVAALEQRERNITAQLQELATAVGVSPEQQTYAIETVGLLGPVVAQPEPVAQTPVAQTPVAGEVGSAVSNIDTLPVGAVIRCNVSMERDRHTWTKTGRDSYDKSDASGRRMGTESAQMVRTHGGQGLVLVALPDTDAPEPEGGNGRLARIERTLDQLVRLAEDRLGTRISR